MCLLMPVLVSCVPFFNENERILFSVAWEQALSSRTNQCRILTDILTNLENGHPEHYKNTLVIQYRSQIRQEILDFGHQALSLLDVLIPRHSIGQIESVVFFHKLRGDYHKAILEASDLTFEAMHQKRKEVVDCYAIGYNLAVQHLSPITYLRLSIAWQLLSFHHDVTLEISEALRVGKEAFSAAVAQLDDLGEDELSSNTWTLLQQFRDTITWWQFV